MMEAQQHRREPQCEQQHWGGGNIGVTTVETRPTQTFVTEMLWVRTTPTYFNRVVKNNHSGGGALET